MEIRSTWPERIGRALIDRDREALSESIRAARSRATGWDDVRLALLRHAALDPADPDRRHPLVVIDAVCDLVPTYPEAASWDRLVPAAAEFLIGRAEGCLAVARPRVETPAEGEIQVVPASILEDALAEGDSDAIRRAVRLLLRATRSRDALLEIFLEAIAPENATPGSLLPHTMATVKALHPIEWDEEDPILAGWIEAIGAHRIPPAPLISGMPPPVPCRAAYSASMEHKEPETVWLYAAHAFQAERYAMLRPKGVRWGLRAWIVERLFDGDAERMDREEGLLGPPGAGEGDRSDAASGSGAAHGAEIDAFAHRLADESAPALAAGNAEPIIALNAARWGIHLLGPERGPALAERAEERIAALLSRAPNEGDTR